MRKFWLGMIFIILSIALLIGEGIRLGPRLLDYKESRDFYDQMESDYTKPQEEDEELERELVDIEKIERISEFACIDVNAEELMERNEDYAGWLHIPKTEISYPVVKSRDNKDYLHMNFYKRNTYAGSIFMDYRCENGVLDHHTILYGHNMRDGSMFAGLHNYKNPTYLETHPVFWFITPEYKLLYKIFAVNYVDAYDNFIYEIDYKNNLELLRVMEKMKEESLVQSDIELNEEDYIMSLSTCTSDKNTRILITGILLGNMNNNLLGYY